MLLCLPRIHRWMPGRFFYSQTGRSMLFIARTRVFSTKPEVPLAVQRAAFSSSIRLTATSKDQELFCKILKFGSDQRLFEVVDGISPYPPAAIDIGIASVSFGAREWATILNDIRSAGITIDADLSPGVMKELSTRIVSFWARRDAMIAYELYLATASTNFRITTPAISLLLRSCLKLGYINGAITCAADPSVAVKEAWHFVNAITSVLGGETPPALNIEAAKALGTMILQVVQSRGIQPERRQDWQATLLVLQATGASSDYLEVVRYVLHRWPNFWTHRFLSSLLRRLVRLQFYRLAVRLVADMPSSRRKSRVLIGQLAEQLALASQPRFAFKVWELLSPLARSNATISQKVLRAVEFQYKSPSLPQILRVPRILLQSIKVTNRSLNIALTLLVRANQVSAARALLYRLQCRDKRRISSTSLNILLSHELVSRRSFRNARQIKHVLEQYRVLFSGDVMRPDPVTLNILLKNTVRWKFVVGVKELHKLFQDCVRAGYPSGSASWSQRPSELHGTTQSEDLPSVPSHLSLEKHIKPLYKTFIRAFQIRGDHESARTVTTILKNLSRI